MTEFEKLNLPSFYTIKECGEWLTGEKTLFWATPQKIEGESGEQTIAGLMVKVKTMALLELMRINLMKYEIRSKTKEGRLPVSIDKHPIKPYIIKA
jgi:hypothetical protein